MRPLEFSEFIKSGGSAKCLTFRVDGEDAASWKQSASRVAGVLSLCMVWRGPMVNELYLLRHGIAVDPGFSGMSDDARPLTEKGKKRMRQIGRACACSSWSSIASSPARFRGPGNRRARRPRPGCERPARDVERVANRL